MPIAVRTCGSCGERLPDGHAADQPCPMCGALAKPDAEPAPPELVPQPFPAVREIVETLLSITIVVALLFLALMLLFAGC